MTESTIDMDRAMQGIDCEVITWTKCSDRMPPSGGTVIVRDKVLDINTIVLSSFLNEICETCDIRLIYIKGCMEWTSYNPEAWAELNRK